MACICALVREELNELIWYMELKALCIVEVDAPFIDEVASAP
jgi:hypothetical protein